MRILLVNDDGINASGLQNLAQSLSTEHEVYIVAPLKEQSGMSQALTLNHNLMIYKKYLKLGEKIAYAVDGTPGDCVKIGLESLIKTKIDLVISGINKGYNLGTDVIYSGTVGAATEGYIHGVNALALSVSIDNTIPDARLNEITKELISKLFSKANSTQLLYNVNFPPSLGENIIFAMTEQGIRQYEHEFYIREVEPEVIEYGIKGKALDVPNSPNSDIAAINRGEIAITPLMINRTNYEVLTGCSKF